MLHAALLVAPWNSSAGAQDELLKDVFPGAQLTDHFAEAGTDLHISAYSRITSQGREYIALTYHEPYPNSTRNRYIGLALLELAGTEYRTLLDEVAADDGSGLGVQKPFLYTLDATDLVVFPTCYRGCEYTFFRLHPAPSRVRVENYQGLRDGEFFTRSGAETTFGASGLSTRFTIARREDASCCPSGGTLSVFYELRGDRFQVSRVERQAADPATR